MHNELQHFYAPFFHQTAYLKFGWFGMGKGRGEDSCWWLYGRNPGLASWLWDNEIDSSFLTCARGSLSCQPAGGLCWVWCLWPPHWRRDPVSRKLRIYWVYSNRSHDCRSFSRQHSLEFKRFVRGTSKVTRVTWGRTQCPGLWVWRLHYSSWRSSLH